MDDQDLHQVSKTVGPGSLQTVMELVGDCVVVTLDGEIDLQTAPAMRAALDRALLRAHRTLIIDLSAVTFLGSKGIQLLLEVADATSGRGLELRVVSGTRAVDRPLQLAGVHEVLHLFPTRELAL